MQPRQLPGLTQQPPSKAAGSEGLWPRTTGSGGGSISNQREPRAPGLQQRVPAARRLRRILAPTVCIWNRGWKPATHRGETFKAAGSPQLRDSSLQIPHRVHPDPEETDSAESLLQDQAGSKLQIRSLPSFDAQGVYGRSEKQEIYGESSTTGTKMLFL